MPCNSSSTTERIIERGMKWMREREVERRERGSNSSIRPFDCHEIELS